MTSSMALNVGVNNNTKKEKSESINATTHKQTVGFRVWACVPFTRFIVSPILITCLLLSFQQLGVIQDRVKDPILWFVALLEACMPSAQNFVLMLQVANKPEQSGTIARFLFFIYATSMVPVVFIVSMALQKLGLT